MSLRRRRLAATALVATAPFVLSACGTSFNAQTNQQYQPGIGANVRDLDAPVQVYNGLFVDNGDGTATFSGALLARGEDERIVESVEVTPEEGQSVEAVLPGTLRLPAEVLVPVGEAGEIFVESPAVRAGYYVSMTLTLASGDQVSLRVPVEPREEMYASVAQTPSTPEAPGDDTGETGVEVDPDFGVEGESTLDTER
ncbi:hypothetical protein D9V41_13795 [Aeromicrobium phragmitis]|uniref:Copper chaperone PCu(A)C n=1 Tax=Aeromicrobium phragmitis TaxID=2478914 RepID=A0A3L8PJX1_9ACTN|nr:hypothetical protein [Aeromicrobium phragmitis]RLV54888.1 hypothetical protein D9V41_13795 [Aeromicrobium phragmitis]